MSDKQDTRRDIGWLRHLNRTAKAPFRAMKKWAKQRQKIRRFNSLAKYARQKQEHAPTKKAALKWKELHFDALHKAKWLDEHKDRGPIPVANLTTFDGRQVPGWIAQILDNARDAGAWNGQVISGYRSPAYSISLCVAICGRSSCPGTCGGAASNHAAPPSGTGRPYEGAVDVSDPAGLQSYCRNHNIPLHGNGEALPLDHNHFSNSGR